MARDKKGKKSRVGETGEVGATEVTKESHDISQEENIKETKWCADSNHTIPLDDETYDDIPKKKVNKKSKKQREVEDNVLLNEKQSKSIDEELVTSSKKKKVLNSKAKKQNDDAVDESISEGKKFGNKKMVNVDKQDSSEDEQESLQINAGKKTKKGKSFGVEYEKPSLKASGFQMLDIEGDDVDDQEANEQVPDAEENHAESVLLKKQETKGNRKSKKKERKRRGDDSDEDISKLLEELALEMSGQQPPSAPAEPVPEDEPHDEVKPTKKKKNKKDIEEKSQEQPEEKESSVGPLEDQFTIKTAAQKKKEKKEKERQKKIAQNEQKPSSKSLPNAEPVSKLKESIVSEKEVTELPAELKEDDAKKKKKTKEDDKKEKKRPGKKQIAAMQEALKKVREEEERLKLEEEAKIRAAEEAERLRQEKLRLEQERKEKKKQKEKEKRERLKAEGKLLSKSQKQNRARMAATLAALREQGVEVPQIGEKKERAPRLGDRKKSAKKSTAQSVQSTNTDALKESRDTTPEVETLDLIDEKDTSHQEIEEEIVDDDVKDAWDETTDEENESSKFENFNKSSEESEESDSEESESDSSGSDSEYESTDSESEKKRNYENIREKILERIQKRREENERNRSIAVLRSPVVCVLGHVDTGKTKILDKIRRTHVQDSEAGGITQQIGATMVPEDALKEQCKMVKNFSEMELKVPGLLIIDTPGHESFSNLRSRGSSLCDIAVLVVDIMHGIEPQTEESIELLKKKKTPFIVALNKIDRLYEWKSIRNKDIADVIKAQPRNTKMEFDDRAKAIILQFANLGLNAVLCYENTDPRSYISMVPTSAATGDGMGNLMALLVQLTQQMMAKRLSFSEELQATVLEVKAIPGLGTTIDAILVNGRLREGDTMVLAGHEGPVVTQIRSLLMPQPLKELRVKNPYQEYKEVIGAQGVKIAGKDLDKVIAGIQLLVAQTPEEIPILKEEVAALLSEAMNHIKLAERGVYVQASTLGSLEALLEFLKTSKIPYSGIRIGPVVKKDVMKASIMLEHDSQYAVILAFDVKIERDAQELAESLGVKIFQADIIYHLFDKFTAYREELKNKKRDELKSVAIFPCKLRILPQYIFNSRDPIVVGVVVEAGIVREGTPLCVPSREFLEIGTVTTIEVNHKAIESARKGQEVCIKIEPASGEAPKMYGRHFEHTDLLVSKITRQSIDVCKEFFRDDLLKTDWQLMVELKKTFQIL